MRDQALRAGIAGPGFARLPFARQTRSLSRTGEFLCGAAFVQSDLRGWFWRSWNRARHDGGGRWIAGAYGYGYPGWGGYPYPYVIDPGFYDWGDSATLIMGLVSWRREPGLCGSSSLPELWRCSEPPQEPIPTHGDNLHRRDLSMRDRLPPLTAPPLQPLTVIFKNGRAPETMQNYMVNGRRLTDLDQQHYEQIPLDQIDVAATEQANRARGLDFQVPAGSR